MGARNAYTHLLALSAKTPNELQHRLGHLFGRILYTEKGADGFAVCTDELFGGCQHELLAQAVADKGTSVITSLDSACISNLGKGHEITCEHGLGHGLIQYFGYSFSNLVTSLHTCSTLKSEHQTKGCFGGVLMEYNLHTMSDVHERPATASNLYSPCEKLEPVYTAACYFWLPQWWYKAKIKETALSRRFEEVGSLCLKALTPNARASCFEGIGYGGTPLVEFDREKTIQLCHNASHGNSLYEKKCWDEASLAVH